MREPSTIALHEIIGTEAVLDMFAEECIEAAHAAMKLARYDRDTNPTATKDRLELVRKLESEIGDIENCISFLFAMDIMSSEYDRLSKMTRMVKRFIDKAKDEKEEEMLKGGCLKHGYVRIPDIKADTIITGTIDGISECDCKKSK